MRRATNVALAVLMTTVLVAALMASMIGVAYGDPVAGTPPAQTPDFDYYLDFHPRLSEAYSEWLGYTPDQTLPAEIAQLGFTKACDGSRCNAGRHVLSDDLQGCVTGEDCIVYRDGCCFQVPMV